MVESFGLVLLRFNVPVNNFSVMSGRSHRFLCITSTFWEVNVSCSRTQHGDLSEDRGRIVPNFELLRDTIYIVVRLTCMNEEDPIKNEAARVLTRLFFFSDTQGQLTPKSAVEFCRNSNSPKLLWLSSLPARMKKIQSKMKALEC